MESLTSKEFFDKLNAGTLQPSWVLKGIVKKSEKDSELLFTRKVDFVNWVKIPSSMIESVQVIKSFTKADELYTVVKLYLKTPATPEGKILHELLSSAEGEEMDDEKFSWKNKIMEWFGGHGMSGKSCGAGHDGHHWGCGCHHHFGFGGHHCCHGESEEDSKSNLKK